MAATQPASGKESIMDKKQANQQNNLAHALAFAAGTLYAMAGQYADLEGNAARRKREMWEQAADWLAEKAKEMNQPPTTNQ